MLFFVQVEHEQTEEQPDVIDEPSVEQDQEPYYDQGNTVTEEQETYPEDVPQADEQQYEEEYPQDAPVDEVRTIEGPDMTSVLCCTLLAL